MPVPEQDHRNSEPQASVVLTEVSEDAAIGFGPLKALLGAIVAVYADHEVRHHPLVEIDVQPTPLQESAAVRTKVEVLLSRIVPLDALFSTSPGDVDELRRRDDVMRYVVIPLCDQH